MEENTHKLQESGTKAALEDFLYSIPKSAHSEMMRAIKAKSKPQVAAVLKKNKVKMPFGERQSVQAAMDYFMDFFGPMESVQEAVTDYKKVGTHTYMRKDKGPWRPVNFDIEFKTVDKITYFRKDRGPWLPMKKGDKYLGKNESVEMGNDVVSEASGFKMNDPRLVKAAQSILPPEDKNNGPLIGKITRFMFDVWSSGNGKTRLPELTRLARTKFGLVPGRSPIQTSGFEPEGDDITEKVELDARKGEFKRTVFRLSNDRAIREARAKGNRFAGLYDDGSGKGAYVPGPVDVKKENNTFQKELDGRMKSFKEAMKRVEMYRKIREEKKKMLTGQSVKEEVEIEEASENLAGCVEMVNGKFSMNEAELSPTQKRYRAFFKTALKKFGKDSPDKMDDGEKKKFFAYVKSNWKG